MQGIERFPARRPTSSPSGLGLQPEFLQLDDTFVLPRELSFSILTTVLSAINHVFGEPFLKVRRFSLSNYPLPQQLFCFENHRPSF